MPSRKSAEAGGKLSLKSSLVLLLPYYKLIVAVTNPLPKRRMVSEKIRRYRKVHILENIKQHMNIICVTK
jgi:hypothetical protein